MEVLVAETTSQQERLQAIAEKRKRQAEIENKRRQLDEDRRRLQHLKSKALRERWLLEGTPPSTTDGDSDMRKQMQEDEQKAKLLEGSICRLEKEIEVLENGDVAPAATPKENTAAPSPTRAAPSPAKDTEKMVNSQQTPAGTPKEKRVSNTPLRTGEGSNRMKAAMYSVEITVEKDKVTGETRVLSSTTLLPQEPRPQGVKVYEDEMKVVHAVDGATENGIQPLSSSEVDELIHKADENVEDEAETKKVLGLQDTITAELVVIDDAAAAKEPPDAVAPPNGSAAPAETPAAAAAAPGAREEPAAQEGPGGGGGGDPQDLDMKKQRCKCCSVM
ncbi:paralemmin-1 isoform X2 [Sorex fumeus]|uniref:paralemmin-1 isoform X2 n=1 Tax=Sorex fumeus TaxID=62283 RepID=UPI0024AD3806|nr:paralemmin-1 isoform X2 [Sorex fumeus]